MKKFTITLCSLLITTALQAQSIFWKQTNGPGGGAPVHEVLETNNGDMFISLCCGTGQGIYCSTDGGNSWHNKSKGLPKGDCRDVITNKEGILFTVELWSGVYKSSDYGNNWEYIPSSPSDPMSIIIDSSGIIYLGTLGQGIYRSLNNGVTWEQSNSGPGYWVNDLNIGPNGEVYASADGSGLYCSIDNGITWNFIGLAGKDPMNVDFDEDGNILACTLYDGLYRSSDNGISWELISNVVTTTFGYWDVGLDSSGHIFLTTDGGLWRSTDNGLNWVKINSIPQLRNFWCHSSGHLFIGGADFGIWKSTDDGLTWYGTGPALSSVFSMTTYGSNQILAGADPLPDTGGGRGYGVYSSSNGGASWSLTGLMMAFAYSLTTSDTVIFAGTENGVYRSLDSAMTWTFSGLNNNVVKVVKATSSGEIFAGVEGLGLYRSFDKGESWNFAGLPNMTVMSVASNDSGGLFAGTSSGIYYSEDNGLNWEFSGLTNTQVLSTSIIDNGLIFAGTESGIYYSNNNGSSWDFNALPDTKIYQLLTSGSTQLFAGTSNGVYLSKDNGETWESISVGLDNLNVKAIAIDSAGYLYAGVDFKGVYRSVYQDQVYIYTVLDDQIVCPNNNVVFEIKAIGTPPIQYQWQKDGIDIPGATDSILVIESVQNEDDGNYRCIASNNYGVDTSNTVKLTVEFVAPDSLILYCTFDDVNSITNPVTGPGGTFNANPETNFTTGQIGNAYLANYYDVNLVSFPKEVLPANRGCIEFWARLFDMPYYIGGGVVWGGRPWFFHAGEFYGNSNTSYCLKLEANNGMGGAGLCSTAGNGCAATGYWYNSYSYESILGDVNAWHHYALVWDMCGVPGSVWKMQEYVDGIPHGSCDYDPGHIYDPDSLPTVKNGAFNIIAFVGLDQGGAAIDELKIWNYPKTQFIDHAYIYTVLNDQQICKNSNITFEVKAVGIPPLNYQWQKDGTDIIGATDSILTISRVQEVDKGEYRCIASNSYGIDTSNSAMLWIEFAESTDIQGFTYIPEYQVATYSVQIQQGHSYEFIVDGGNRIDGTENSITIHWGKPGQGYVKLIETSDIGCNADTNSLNVIIGSTGQIDQETQNLSIYPNPVKDNLFIKFDDATLTDISISLVDVSGRLIIQREFEHINLDKEQVLDLSSMKSGIYFLEIISESYSRVYKIIKE